MREEAPEITLFLVVVEVVHTDRRGKERLRTPGLCVILTHRSPGHFDARVRAWESRP